jgi:hypothetical protein
MDGAISRIIAISAASRARSASSIPWVSCPLPASWSWASARWKDSPRTR